MSDPSTTQAQAVTAPLQRLRNRLRWRQVAWGAFSCLGLLVCALALADAGNRLVSMREALLFWTVGCAAAASLLAFLAVVCRAVWNAPSVPEMALEVERVHPELLDALVCAAEIEAKPSDRRRLLETLLLERVSETVDADTYGYDVLPERLRWGRLSILGMVFGVGLLLMVQTPAFRKVLYHGGDLARGRSTGLVVAAPSDPVPEHSDVRVSTRVLRWQPQASIVVQRPDGTRDRFVMNRDGERSRFFTFYDVTEELRFRVVTPSLASAWHRIETYRPPEFRSVEIRVTAPAYTRRAEQVLEAFESFTAVAGSRVKVSVSVAEGVAATLASDALGRLPFAMIGTTGTCSWQVVEALTFRVGLVSPEGWRADGRDVQVRVEPDLPPVVAVVRPRRDVQAKVGERVPVEVRASDDFGVAEVAVSYAVSGGPRQTVPLFNGPTDGPRVRDHLLEHIWDPEAMGLKPGDVISYLFTATDVREPGSQTARSDVYFLVVRPDLDQEEQEQEGQEGQQEQKLDIGPLIAELKRLIRLTWDTMNLEGDENRQLLAELRADMGELETAVGKMFNELMNSTGGLVAGNIVPLFEEARRELAAASQILARGLAEESLGPQERALSALVRLENELLENAARSQGQSGQQQQEQESGRQEREELSESRRQQERMEALREALEAVRRLSQRQDRLNRSLQRTPDQAAADVRSGLAARQRDIEADTEPLRKDLEAVPDAARAARDLTLAQRAMERGANDVDANDIRAGERQGVRAHGFLAAAAASLEDAVRRAAGNEISRLAQMTQQLADAQRRLAQTSRSLAEAASPSEAEMDRALDGQRQLGEVSDAVQGDIERTAGRMEEMYPEAAKALAEAVENAREEGLEERMAQASNALLYRRFGRAGRDQTAAANVLQQMASELEQASSLLPQISREELLEAIAKLRQRAAEAEQAMQNEGENGRAALEQLREQSSQDLDRVASGVKDPALQQISDDMAMPLGGESAGAAGRQLLGMFRAAVSVLQRHLARTELERRIGLNRRLSEPPEKYRRLVELYFRDLSEEQ